MLMKHLPFHSLWHYNFEMLFECTYCGQALEAETIYSGQAVSCPGCGEETLAPELAVADTEESAEMTLIVETLQSEIDHGQMTLSSFMAKQGIEGCIDLDSSSKLGTASGILNADKDRKYKLGGVVAKGGMGAIIDVRDLNLRRSLAMKVLLDPEQAGREQILRFIQEAQVTSQLQHPSIVPIYELGVDNSENVFYTMKFVKGRNLNDILKGIRKGDRKTIEEYPLSRLLDVFQRVCDAIAFAHSRRVIHRDLKPDNIMVGEYGEVQVMDWGLAKVLPRKKTNSGSNISAADREKKLKSFIDSVSMDKEAGMLKSLDGDIMGTPWFMAPEQALGEIESIDNHTDIYALGGILYNILTLSMPITGNDIGEILNKVINGEIIPPNELCRSTKGKNNLPHCEGGRVPEALAAVAMKAMAQNPEDRYQYVKFIQREIDKYQHGFAVSAENAGIGRQLSLFIKRNKTVSTAALLILMLMAGATALNYMEKIRAQNAEQDAVSARNEAVEKGKEARDTLDALKRTAPALLEQSRAYVAAQDTEKALEAVLFACTLVPDNPDYHCQRAHILQAILKLKESEEAYGDVLKLNPDHKSAKENLALCGMIIEKNKDSEKLSAATIADLYVKVRKQGRYEDAMALIENITDGGKDLKDFWRNMLEKMGINCRDVNVDEKGILRSINMSGMKFYDLTPLKGLPLTGLNLSGNQWLKDLSPLKGMQLTYISLNDTSVSDITPLKGMPLKTLRFWGGHGKKLSDLSPLKGMPLETLTVVSTDVSDLTPLEGMSFHELDLAGSIVSDLSLLKNVTCRTLHINGTGVTDLTPIERMELHTLSFSPDRIMKGIDVIRNAESIQYIGLSSGKAMRAAEFWKKYDAGEFNK